MDDCLHNTHGFNIPADYHSFLDFLERVGVGGWIPLETGTLMKNQTPQPVTTYYIVFSLLQTLHFLGRQFFPPFFLQQVFPVLFVFTVLSIYPPKLVTGCHYSAKMKNYLSSAAWFMGLNHLAPMDSYNCHSV